jgi:sporulation protein YlmC with PRC-barrel domain
MDLIRDVLDKQIVDRTGDRLGKVDGLVLTLTDGGRPRVTAIEVGPTILARRSRRVSRPSSGGCSARCRRDREPPGFRHPR